MIEINGAEGGGSVVRLAVGLSAATQQPVTLTNIRAKRPNPGLKAQHIAGIQAVTELTDAETDGVSQGSDTLTFQPQHAPRADIPVQVTVSTAGSVGLTLQPLQIATLHADEPVKVSVDGGATAGKWAPPTDYMECVAMPMMEQLGQQQSLDVKRHGFYPQGGAMVRAMYGPSELQEVDLMERGEVQRICGVSRASQHLQDAEVAERQRKEARRVLANTYPSMELDIATEYVQSRSPGSVIVLWAECETRGEKRVIGGDAIGEKGKRSEQVGKEAAEALLQELGTGAAVDRWLADQLVPLLGLKGGKMQVSGVTDHVETNVAVVQEFVEHRLRIRKEEGVVEATRE